jgi:antitoxin MazE
VDIRVKDGIMIIAPAKRIRGRHKLKDLVTRIPKSYQPGSGSYTYYGKE